MSPKIKKVTREGSYYHVRFRQPWRFEKIRTPDWAARVARSESKGAEVRMGKTEADNWLVQSVLLKPKGIRDKNHAKSIAARIRKEIEE